MVRRDLLTVGELAKEMNTTVRTLQYYDKEGLLKPSSKSDGGRRLYTKKDMIKLHQILSLKYLGFSLDDIKEKLLSIDDPKEVAIILENQARLIKQQIEKLNTELRVTEALYNEVINIEKVDFSKLADIISLLKQNNENYWVVNVFNEELSDHLRDRFKNDTKSGEILFEKYVEVLDKAVDLKKNNELSTSDKAIALAKEWWDMINDFTGGDISILQELIKFNEDKGKWDNSMAEKQMYIDDFIEEALTAYFQNQNIVIHEMEGEDEN